MSVATQMGNVWPATFEVPHRGEPLVDMTMWEQAEVNLQPVGALVIADGGPRRDRRGRGR